MTIWYVDSTGTVNHAPEATPLKKACINSCIAALTKISVPVKSACRNSYDCGSAAFAKVDRTVRTDRLRRWTAGGETGGAYEKIPAEEVEEQEGLIPTPVKTNACSDGGTVKSVYDCGSAAFAKVDRTVRTVLLRRRTAGGETGGAYEKIPAEEVEEQDGLIPEPVKTNACSDAGGAVKSVSYSYGFLTFAKIGYTVRVKVVYRIVQRISGDGNGTKSSVSIYATDFSHESHDGCKFIPGDHGSGENEPKKLFGTRTIAKMVDGFKESMSDPVTKSRIIIYTSMLMDNVLCYGLQHGLAPNGVTVSIILTKTFVDIVIDVVIEMADSREQLSSGSQELITGLEEMDGNWYSSMFDLLKKKFGFVALTNFLVFMVKEFSAFLRTEPFRTQCYSKKMLTLEYLVLMMMKFLEFVKKRHCSAGFLIVLEIVMAVMRSLLSTRFGNEWGFHRSARKGKGMNNNYSNSKKKAAGYGYC